MASGYYPLPRNSDGGAALLDVADKLRRLLDSRGFNGGGALPAAWENTESDNAATDGGYEARLYLALELIEDAVERPRSEPSA